MAMVTYLQDFSFANWYGIKISGRLDAFNDKQVAEQLRQMTLAKSQVVLDLSACDFMSLHMLKFLAELNKDLSKNGGQLALVSLNHNIRRQIEIFLGMKTFKVFTTLRDLNTGLNRQPRSEFQNQNVELVRSNL